MHHKRTRTSSQARRCQRAIAARFAHGAVLAALGWSARRGIRGAVANGWTLDTARDAWVDYACGTARAIAEDAT